MDQGNRLGDDGRDIFERTAGDTEYFGLDAGGAETVDPLSSAAAKGPSKDAAAIGPSRSTAAMGPSGNAAVMKHLAVGGMAPTA